MEEWLAEYSAVPRFSDDPGLGLRLDRRVFGSRRHLRRSDQLVGRRTREIGLRMALGASGAEFCAWACPCSGLSTTDPGSVRWPVPDRRAKYSAIGAPTEEDLLMVLIGRDRESDDAAAGAESISL
jgi:hypothetical protein